MSLLLTLNIFARISIANFEYAIAAWELAEAQPKSPLSSMMESFLTKDKYTFFIRTSKTLMRLIALIQGFQPQNVLILFLFFMKVDDLQGICTI